MLTDIAALIALGVILVEGILLAHFHLRRRAFRDHAGRGNPKGQGCSREQRAAGHRVSIGREARCSHVRFHPSRNLGMSDAILWNLPSPRRRDHGPDFGKSEPRRPLSPINAWPPRLIHWHQPGVKV